MNTISIALCFGNDYCTMAAGALASIIAQASDKYVYDIYIVHNGISEQNQELLKGINKKPNVTVRFIYFDLNKAVDEGGHVYVSRHIATTSYTRLFLHKIIPELDRILYLDGDTIVTTDVAELFNTDLGDSSIGVCQECGIHYDGIEFLKDVKLVSELPEFDDYKNIYEYNRNYMKFSDDDIKYTFNSGVILFNYKKAALPLKKLPEVMEKRYFHHDQDILNIIFRYDRKLLDIKYNTFIDYLPRYMKKNDTLPAIIHFAGPKPYTRESKFGDEYYWDSLKDTGFYDSAVQQLEYSKKLNFRRKVIRRSLKYFIGKRNYDLLKSDPAMFFKTSHSKWLRYIGRFYL